MRLLSQNTIANAQSRFPIAKHNTKQAHAFAIVFLNTKRMVCIKNRLDERTPNQKKYEK